MSEAIVKLSSVETEVREGGQKGRPVHRSLNHYITSRFLNFKC